MGRVTTLVVHIGPGFKLPSTRRCALLVVGTSQCSSKRIPLTYAPREPEVVFRVAEPEIIDRLARMGTKYVPTIKDLKAGQRFQQKQLVQSKFIKPAGSPPARKRKK